MLLTGCEPRFSAARASGTFVDPKLEQQRTILHKALLLYYYSTKIFSAFKLILHKASQVHFYYFYFTFSAPPKEHPH